MSLTNYWSLGFSLYSRVGNQHCSGVTWPVTARQLPFITRHAVSAGLRLCRSSSLLCLHIRNPSLQTLAGSVDISCLSSNLTLSPTGFELPSVFFERGSLLSTPPPISSSVRCISVWVFDPSKQLQSLKVHSTSIQSWPLLGNVESLCPPVLTPIVISRLPAEYCQNCALFPSFLSVLPYL